MHPDVQLELVKQMPAILLALGGMLAALIAAGVAGFVSLRGQLVALHRTVKAVHREQGRPAGPVDVNVVNPAADPVKVTVEAGAETSHA